MNTATRLSLYGISLVGVFAVAFFGGRALIPDDTVAGWTKRADEASQDHDSMESGHEMTEVGGLSVEEGGYRLVTVSAPQRAGENGELSFRILDPSGDPLTRYETSHEKQLHLITVRSDGSSFEHVHPELNQETGTWSIPWSWPEGGSYRLYADFVPADSPSVGDLVLGQGLEVAGRFEPVAKPLSRTDSVAGFEATLSGELKAGSTSHLTARIMRGGKQVTDLEPYLGAAGHLVALREGDLGYLHVHAEEGELDFQAEVPTPGRYLMYLDFKVDGRVHTAEFVLEAK
ncbi:MAG: hypothetical protein J0H66_06365 [Solirubrobacterales bacterium]|nr:hypothetical protein [Solirubrobacterales bacterium]OJU94942.1 MAG: hypothetical protein BGO23_07175 [Solirubrobacterales bacterium 67-14]